MIDWQVALEMTSTSQIPPYSRCCEPNELKVTGSSWKLPTFLTFLMKFQSDAFLGLVFDLNDHSLSISFSFTPALVEKKVSLHWLDRFSTVLQIRKTSLYKKSGNGQLFLKKHMQWNLDFPVLIAENCCILKLWFNFRCKKNPDSLKC